MRFARVGGGGHSLNCLRIADRWCGSMDAGCSWGQTIGRSPTTPARTQSLDSPHTSAVLNSRERLGRVLGALAIQVYAGHYGKNLRLAVRLEEGTWGRGDGAVEANAGEDGEEGWAVGNRWANRMQR